ncbi:hypothetical protein CEXT_490651 [Caerostris extrusa]|uniref:Uncharacterized protein n=1 Tax=Caerostris extrusa TaxID=172846 RepID=A0AAV4X288_CAEEX|nr:hypothetical protein CEXT_490651 [Caerostris extrusa]
MGFRASRFPSPDEALTHLKNVSSDPFRQNFRERGQSLFKIQELGFFSLSKRNSENATSTLPSTRPYISADPNWSPRALSQRRATGALELYDSEMDNCESGLSRIRPAVLSQAFMTPR